MMPNIATRLEQYGAAWQDAVDAGAAPSWALTASQPAVRSRGRRRLLAPLVAAAVVVVIAVGVTVAVRSLTNSQSAPPSAGKTTHTASLRINGVTFQYPSSWTHVRPSFLTAASVQPIGWLTNEPVVAQCHKRPHGSRCGDPISNLGPGGVLVSFAHSTRFDTHTAFPSTTTVAGLPATVHRLHRSCLPGSDSGTEVDVLIDDTAILAIAGCFGPNAANQIHAFNRLLRTAAPPTPTHLPSLAPPQSYCLHTPPPRPGAGTSLVPGTPFAVTICTYVPARRAKTFSDVAELVHALDALPTSPAANGCQARGPDALPAVSTYELHFHYQTGPDVVVNVLPHCRPSINNTLLQSDSATTVIPLIKAALQRRR